MFERSDLNVGPILERTSARALSMAGSHPTASEQSNPNPPDVDDVVERILAEGPLGMTPVARRLGEFRGGRPTHASTPARWATAGVRLPDGSTLRLEAVRMNGRLVTS